ncbi:MAG TPA: hypothetical protein VGV41_06130 [Pseudolabrys sp.]|jgi:hypothetical protein|uniref:hypothetical protein n=1 Tax=Pseudolabrys sp. TaxID=1960880 RepID=UPI002DDC9B4D|nr:hypothetical protein [Pseudolabrys sp.]HEV2628203.1 hypothetical protein [Pseudolabrys sp.]
MLKTLMIGAALAAMIGAPAMAQSYDPSVGSGNIVRGHGHMYSRSTVPSDSYGSDRYGYDTSEGGYGGAYAFAPAHDYDAYGHHRAYRQDQD